jgi:hypothetical protein
MHDDVINISQLQHHSIQFTFSTYSVIQFTYSTYAVLVRTLHMRLLGVGGVGFEVC